MASETERDEYIALEKFPRHAAADTLGTSRNDDIHIPCPASYTMSALNDRFATCATRNNDAIHPEAGT